MDFNSNDSLQKSGFKGFKSVKELWREPDLIPKAPGVYIVINPNFENPQFIYPGVGGFFKDKDPNVSIERLISNLVPSSQVLYVGKAGSLTGSATLNSRIKQYLKFGQGRKVGHWGGRFVWQIKNPENLVFCWKPTPLDLEPRDVELLLLYMFEKQFGKAPFANLTG